VLPSVGNLLRKSSSIIFRWRGRVSIVEGLAVREADYTCQAHALERYDCSTLGT